MPQTAPPQILLVDDHEICLVVGDLLLSPFGVQVVRASGGAAALAACARQDFDLILMDIQMPDLDGVETTRRLRQLANANARAPIIALTLDARFADPVTRRAAGMDGYLAKPLSEATIRPLLAQWGLLNAH
jgi:CheY-like chemotaxis protein